VKAFILAAGYGKRLQPYTDNIPKALVEVQGIPMLEIVIKRLIKYGFSEIIINLHHFGEQIKEFVKSKNYFGINILFSEEKELLDTGGAIKNAAELINNSPVLLHNVDILSDIDLAKFKQTFEHKKADVLLAVKARKSSRYLLFDDNDKLMGWKNTQSGKTILKKGISSGQLHPLAFSGIHILGQKALQLINSYPSGKFSITTFYLEKMEDLDIYSYPHNDNFVIDLGKIDNLQMAQYFDLRKFL
jgi:NDP-sugar pyrophosphorylase family protein